MALDSQDCVDHNSFFFFFTFDSTITYNDTLTKHSCSLPTQKNQKTKPPHISDICTQPGAFTTGSHIVLLMSWINSLCLEPSIPPSVVHSPLLFFFFLIYTPASTLLASSPAPAEYELHLLPVTLGGAERWQITAREAVNGLSSFSFMWTPASFLFHLLLCQSPQANRFLYHLNQPPSPHCYFSISIMALNLAQRRGEQRDDDRDW